LSEELDAIKAIQQILKVTADGIFGVRSRSALDNLIIASKTAPGSPPQWTNAPHKGIASSFADPADIRAFRRCKDRGGSDQDCFKVGDNGVGCWGDDCSEGTGPSCALPPDDMIEKFGSISAAKHAKVNVGIGNKNVQCVLKDRMPWKKNIKNRAIIDLNPDAVRALGLEPPIMAEATWVWA
jgi:hypothetical protein